MTNEDGNIIEYLSSHRAEKKHQGKDPEEF